MATPISNATLELRRRQTEGVEVETPSGLFVKIKPISLHALIKKGLFPRSLVNIAMTGFPVEGGDVNLETEEDVQTLLDQQEKTDEIMFHTLSNVLVSPKLVQNARDGEDEIELSWLDQLDQAYLLRIINMPISEWDSFRRELSPDVPNLVEHAGVSQESE